MCYYVLQNTLFLLIINALYCNGFMRNSVEEFEQTIIKAMPHKHQTPSDSYSEFKQVGNIVSRNLQANKNLGKSPSIFTLNTLKDGEVIDFKPGQDAPNFHIWSLNGLVEFPSELFRNKSIFLHVFNADSAFLECLWTSDEALSPLVDSDVPSQTLFIFIPSVAGVNDKYGAIWMKDRLRTVAERRKNLVKDVNEVMQRFVFSAIPFHKMGTWIPSAMRQWQCVDHLCGLDQVLIQTPTGYPAVLKRLNARYDWLPSPESVFNNKTVGLVSVGNGCSTTSEVNNSIALVSSQGCSVIEKLGNMSKSGAKGVVIYAYQNEPVQEVKCNGSDCNSNPGIPTVMVEWSDIFKGNLSMNITFQNTPSENFFMAVNRQAKLAEVGWFLFPSMKFLIWQSQWFDFKIQLLANLSVPHVTASVFADQVMQGHNGVVVNYTLPSVTDMRRFRKIQLDVSLSCPGDKDTSCAHWDRIMSLYVCCNSVPHTCGMELGRWITPFRRRIGRWLTDISALLPLLGDGHCTFTMKTDWYAMPWIPSLNIRFSESRQNGELYPADVIVLYEPGATFNKSYNTNFKPINFTLPKDVEKVEIYSLITGHGSDENGCGEFCVTSHHFNVNGHIDNITFSQAGTPFGCADQVPTGVEPNEHGTWLYGRNGWCDGRNVFPWIVDISGHIKPPGEVNSLQYYGWFNGTDPDPKSNPGLIVIYSYMIYYRKFQDQT